MRSTRRDGSGPGATTGVGSSAPVLRPAAPRSRSTSASISPRCHRPRKMSPDSRRIPERRPASRHNASRRPVALRHAPSFGGSVQDFSGLLSISTLPIRPKGCQSGNDEEVDMQYVMLIFQGTTPLPNSDEWAALSDEEQKQIYADYAALNETPGVSPGLPMGLPENATTVRVEGGKTLTTDGPFVGMKEAVGGFFVLEADDLDAAIEVAARVPAARLGGAVEIRPSEVYW